MEAVSEGQKTDFCWNIGGLGEPENAFLLIPTKWEVGIKEPARCEINRLLTIENHRQYVRRKACELRKLSHADATAPML